MVSIIIKLGLDGAQRQVTQGLTARQKDLKKEKGKFIQYLAALAVLPRTILNNWMNSSFSFKSSWCNSYHSKSSFRQDSKRGKELKKFFPQTEATTFAFSSVSFYILIGLGWYNPILLYLGGITLYYCIWVV